MNFPYRGVGATRGNPCGIPYVENAPVYRVQGGAFVVKENAERMKEELKEKGYDAFIVTV